MQISMIAAMSSNRVIGKDGKLPWNLPDDLRKFKEITSGHIIVMGKTTYESIGRPLPNRENIVLSPDVIHGVKTYSNMEDLFKYLNTQEGEIFVIGGASVYTQFLDYADKIYLTLVKKDYVGDTYFPIFEDKFEETNRETFEEFDFIVYKKAL